MLEKVADDEVGEAAARVRARRSPSARGSPTRGRRDVVVEAPAVVVGDEDRRRRPRGPVARASTPPVRSSCRPAASTRSCAGRLRPPGRRAEGWRRSEACRPPRRSVPVAAKRRGSTGRCSGSRQTAGRSTRCPGARGWCGSTPAPVPAYSSQLSPLAGQPVHDRGHPWHGRWPVRPRAVLRRHARGDVHDHRRRRRTPGCVHEAVATPARARPGLPETT